MKVKGNGYVISWRNQHFFLAQRRTYNPYIPNIHALNSDTHVLRILYEYTKKRCVGVAIEGMDIWYMVVVTETPQKRNKRKTKMGASLPENMELAPIFPLLFSKHSLV